MGKNSFFCQIRVGKKEKLAMIWKIYFGIVATLCVGELN
jgi:hypothetical protein